MMRILMWLLMFVVVSTAHRHTGAAGMIPADTSQAVFGRRVTQGCPDDVEDVRYNQDTRQTAVYPAGIGWATVDYAVTGFGQNGMELCTATSVGEDGPDCCRGRYAAVRGDKMAVEIGSPAAPLKFTDTDSAETPNPDESASGDGGSEGRFYLFAGMAAAGILILYIQFYKHTARSA